MRKVILVAVLITIALGLRALRLTATPLWVDEAESSINALSILEHGYPTGHHLGIPVYENMLVRQWPGHPEYEFKDISYSDRGVAVYHGWLPLGAIAGSFRLFGIAPPVNQSDWLVAIDEAAWRHKTLAARLPALMFATGFLIFMFAAGRRLGGDDVAFAALVLAGFSSSLIIATSAARYYAPTLALSAAAVLTLWRVTTRGAWWDYTVHAIMLVALFHTHMIAFANLVLLTIFAVMAWCRSMRAVARLAASGALVAAGIAPWLVFTGFLEHLREIPSGRPLVTFPNDLLLYIGARLHYLWVYAMGLAWFALVAFVLYGRVPQWLAEPWERHSRQYVLLLAWMVIATALWHLFTPPASLFPQRLSLCLFVPGFLLLGFLFADASRSVAPGWANWLAPALSLAFLVVSGTLGPRLTPVPGFDALAETFDVVNRLGLRSDAKVYASPSTHLVFSFYGERPVQSIAPIRKSFLDTYAGEVVYISSHFAHECAAPDKALLQRVAANHGEPLSDEDARSWECRLKTRYMRESVQPFVAELVPPLEPVPPFVADAMSSLREIVEMQAEITCRPFAHVPIFRGYKLRTAADLWQVFFYRLIGPEQRSGARFNAAARLKRSRAYLVPGAFRVVFYSPAPSTPRAE